MACFLVQKWWWTNLFALLLKLQALANLAYEMNAKSVALISSSRASVHTFLEDATALGIRAPHILELESLKNSNNKIRNNHERLPQKVEKFLRQLPQKRPVVAVVLEAVEAVAIGEYFIKTIFFFVKTIYWWKIALISRKSYLDFHYVTVKITGIYSYTEKISRETTFL